MAFVVIPLQELQKGSYPTWDFEGLCVFRNPLCHEPQIFWVFFLRGKIPLVTTKTPKSGDKRNNSTLLTFICPSELIFRKKWDYLRVAPMEDLFQTTKNTNSTFKATKLKKNRTEFILFGNPTTVILFCWATLKKSTLGQVGQSVGETTFFQGSSKAYSPATLGILLEIEKSLRTQIINLKEKKSGKCSKVIFLMSGHF